MEINITSRCEACDELRGPLSPIQGEGGPRYLCPPCLHAFLTEEVRALTGRVEAMEGTKGGEMAENRATEGLEGGEGSSPSPEPRQGSAAFLCGPPAIQAEFYEDGTPKDWLTLEVRADDFRTLNRLAQTWRCSRENVVGVLCRAARMQVWPLGDVLTSYPEFQSWVERLVHAEQAPLRRAVRVEALRWPFHPGSSSDASRVTDPTGEEEGGEPGDAA